MVEVSSKNEVKDMEKINVDKLVYVNGDIGIYDAKTRTAVVGSCGIISYISQYLKGKLRTIIFAGTNGVEIQHFSKEQKRDAQFEVDKCFYLSDDDLLARLRLQVYEGN